MHHIFVVIGYMQCSTVHVTKLTNVTNNCVGNAESYTKEALQQLLWKIWNVSGIKGHLALPNHFSIKSFWISDAAPAMPTWSSHFHSCCAHVQCYALLITVLNAELWYQHGPWGQVITLLNLGSGAISAVVVSTTRWRHTLSMMRFYFLFLLLLKTLLSWPSCSKVHSNMHEKRRWFQGVERKHKWSFEQNCRLPTACTRLIFGSSLHDSIVQWLSRFTYYVQNVL